MHILYVIDSLGMGGAERSLAAVAPFHIRRGMKLDVAYLVRRAGVERDLERAGAKLFRITRTSRFGRVRELRFLARERGVDLIHTTLFEADIIGRLGGVTARLPVVSSLVNVSYGREYLADPGVAGWKMRSAQLVDAITGRGVVRWHAISAHVSDIMARRLRIPRDRIEVVPRGRDVETLGQRSEARREAARKGLGLSQEDRLIIAVARHETQKGLDVLIDALPGVRAELPYARVLVAGREGNQTGALQERAARLGLTDAVSFLGPRGDVADLLCAADAFAFPSRWEGLGTSLLEAMALEVPIVASDLPAVRETLGDDTALLVPKEQPHALASALTTALTDASSASSRSDRARRRFLAKFTAERVAEEMERFYERALGAHRRG